MEEGLNVLVDFALVIAVWSAAAPLAISALKNIGGNWPTLAKQAISGAFALAGAVVAYAVAVGFGVVDILDSAVWQPLLIGTLGALSAQYAIYSTMWKGTAVEATLSGFGNGNA